MMGSDEWAWHHVGLQDGRRCPKWAVGSTGRERAVGSRGLVWMWIWQCEGDSWAVVGVACLCPRPIEP